MSRIITPADLMKTPDVAAADQTAQPQVEVPKKQTKRNYTGGGFMPVDMGQVARTADVADRSIFDETLGAASYGAASAASALTKNIGQTFGIDSLTNMSQDLQRFKSDNPQYAPEHVDHWYNLVTSPGALVSNVSAGSAQFAATAGALAIPYAGPALAFGLTYGIESQNHYDDAIAAGAAPETAMRAARIGGAVSAAVNLIPASKLFKSFTGGKNEIARIAFKEAVDNAPASLAPELAHRAGMLAVANVLQRDVSSSEVDAILGSQTNWASGLVRKFAPEGTLTGAVDLLEKPAVSGMLSLGGWNVAGGTLDTVIKQSIYGENLPDFNWADYLDQQAQSFLVGAATHAMMGIPLHEAGKMKAGGVKPTTFDYTKLEPDIVSKDAWYNQVLGKVSDEQRPVATKLMDAMVGHLADANGMIDANEARKRYLLLSKTTADIDGNPIVQDGEYLEQSVNKVLAHIIPPDSTPDTILRKNSELLADLTQSPAITREDMLWSGAEHLLHGQPDAELNVTQLTDLAKNRLEYLKKSTEFTTDNKLDGFDSGNNTLLIKWPLSDEFSKILFGSGQVDVDGVEQASRAIKNYDTGDVLKDRFVVQQGLLDTVEKEFNFFTVPHDLIEHTNNIFKKLDSQFEFKDVDQPSATFVITPTVRQAVLDGQPLFQPLLDKSPEGLNKWLRETAVNSPYGKAKGVLMKDGHIYLSDADDHALILKTLERKGYSVRDVEGTLYIDPPREGSTRAPIALVDRDAASQFYGAMPHGSGSSFINLDNPKSISYVKGTEYLAQQFKGSTTFLRDINGMTRAFIEMTQHADFSTPFHEMAHVLTKFSTPQEQELMSKMVGKEWGHWGTAEWEKIAKAFEGYLIQGKAPDSALQPFFDRGEKFMRDIYKNTRKSYLEKTLTPEALELFDNWFVKDNPETKAARDAYTQSMGVYAAAEAHMDQIEGNYPSAHPLSVDAQEEYFAANKTLATARELYKNALTDRLTRESEVDRWANATKAVYTQQDSETPEQSARRFSIGGMWKAVQKLWSFETVLRANKFGKELTERVNTAFGKAEHWAQPLYLDANQNLKLAGKSAVEETEKLKQADPSHKISLWTDLRRTEANNPWRISPPKGSGLSMVQRAVYAANHTLKQMSENLGVTRTYAGGSVEPVRAGENQIDTGMDNLKVPRIFTKQFRDAYQTNAQVRELFKTMMATEVDPTTYKKDPRKVQEILPKLEGMLNNADIRKSGSLEYGRVLDLVPDGMMVDGKELPIFESHPGELLNRTIHSQTTRIAFIEQFGQGNLASAKISHWAEFANGVFDAGVKTNGDLYREKLRAFKDSQGNKIVDDTTLDNMNFSQMKMLGKQYDIKYGLTDADYNDGSKDFKASDLQNKDGTFDKNKVKKLQGLAKKLGGVTVDQPVPDLISEVRKRLLTSPVDVMEDLKKGYVQSGGKDMLTWDRYVSLAQGIDPYQYRPGVAGKLYNNIRGVMAALNTGLVGVPYFATQAFNMAPVKGMGLLDLFESFRQTITNPLATKEMMREFGVMFEPGVVYRRDLGLDGFGRKVYDFAYKYFGLKHVDDFSFGIATRMGATYADRMNQKMDRGDLNSAARLRLSPAEIEQLQNHAMTPELKTKIVRGFVDSSLIYSSPQFKKGFLDTHPVAKMMLAYNSYAVGMARYMGHFSGEITDAIKSGDSSARAGAAVKLVSLVGAAVGASYAASVMSQALKLNATKQASFKKEETLKELGQALVDFGLLGPLMKFKFALGADGGDTHNILSFLMPQFDTIANTTASLLSTTEAPQGKYANYGFAERMLRTLGDESPEWKIYRQLDQSFRTPEALAYNEAFTEAEDYKDRLSHKTGIARADKGGFQNPLVQPLYLDMRNLDIDSAQVDLQHYYNEMYKRFNNPDFVNSGLDPEKVKSTLKSSLLSRAPLNMNPIELATFMNKYDARSAAQMYKADAMYKAYVEALVPDSH